MNNYMSYNDPNDFGPLDGSMNAASLGGRGTQGGRLMASGIGASISPNVGIQGTVGVGGGDSSLDTVVKGVPIQCMVRIKQNDGYQKDDIKILQNRI